MSTSLPLRCWMIVVLALSLAGCELVADFDRNKIPEPERDAEVFDADVVIDASTGDSSTPDAAAPEEDSGADEDGGR